MSEEKTNISFCVYDLETIKNVFIANFLEYNTNKKKGFVITSWDVLIKFVRFVKKTIKHDYYFVGFNNNAFDNQIVRFILDNVTDWYNWKIPIDEVITLIYDEAQRLINLSDQDRIYNTISESRMGFKSIDLFKQKHYDRPQKATSLKWVQFSMRYPNIEEQPFPHDIELTPEQIEKVDSYCWNDVESTARFFGEIMFETELRFKLNKIYNLNLTNASEPKIAREIFGTFLCKQMGITYSELRKMRTMRGIIEFKDIIFPYVNFKSKELQDVLALINSKSIDASIGSKDKFEHHFIYGGLEHFIGLGGLHSCIDSGVYVPAEDEICLDIDGKSYYPNLAIQNGLKPEHLGDAFTTTYSFIYKERGNYDKKDPINYVMKLILNSTYGGSNEPNGYFYDPRFTYSITVNGYLSLLMLYESLICGLDYIKPIQCNTDGISVIIKKKEYEKALGLFKEWENTTKIELEYVQYSKMIIRDVNNYIAVGVNGTVKKKGMFETKLEHHKNPSFLVVPLALKQYFVNGTPIQKFINEHNNIYNFCGGVKKKSNFELNLYNLDKGIVKKEKQQKVTRYFVCDYDKGGTLMKDFNDGRQVSVLSDYKVQPLNYVKDENANNYPINRIFYINQCQKWIDIINGSNQLFLNF